MAQAPDDDFTAIPKAAIIRVGSLIAAALAIALTLVYLLSGGGAEFFHPKIHVYTYLADSGGLKPGLDVMLNGVKVGLVKSVKLAETKDPTRSVRVELKVEERYASDIPVDSIAAVTATNLLGDTFMNITAGHSTSHVTNDSEIASLIQSGSFNPADLVASLQTTIASVGAVLDQIQEGDTPLAQMIRGNELYVNVLSEVEAIRKTIQDNANPHSVTGQMILTSDLLDRIELPIQNIDRMLEEIQRGETPAGRMVTDPAMYDNAVAQIRSVHQTLADDNAGKGPTGQFLQSDDQYRQIETRLKSINDSVDLLTRGDGQMAELLQSSQLYDALAGKSGQMRTFLHEFRDDPQKFLRIKIF